MINEEREKEICPICGCPIVVEEGLPVCYYCGWYEEDKYEGDYDE